MQVQGLNKLPNERIAEEANAVHSERNHKDVH